jgi:hypothetical protein
MTGGYTLHDVDIYSPDANELRLRPDCGAAGMGCILRAGSTVIDYRLLKARDVPNAGLTCDELLTPEGRKVLAYARLRARLAPDPSPVAPNISVAICTKDRPDWLRRLLNSLAAQKTEQTFEIVVVDNNSDSPEVRQVAKASWCDLCPGSPNWAQFCKKRRTCYGDGRGSGLLRR